MNIKVSIGELLDKITILEIKLKKILDPCKKSNIRKEYSHLISVCRFIKNIPLELMSELSQVNRDIWDIEDRIREKEREKKFDNEFIELARSVYFNNDKRAKIKKLINIQTSSELIEEKSYEDYV